MSMQSKFGNNERLQFLIDEYKEADRRANAIKQYQKDIKEAIIAEFSSVDPTTDFEGTENIETNTDAVSLTWKITKKFNESELKEICNAHNTDIEKVASVKYDYSVALMKKLPADIKSELELNAIETKRAATSFKITNFADKKEN